MQRRTPPRGATGGDALEEVGRPFEGLRLGYVRHQVACCVSQTHDAAPHSPVRRMRVVMVRGGAVGARRGRAR